MQTNLAKARENAKRLGVTITPSKVKNKKLDVFKDGKKIASIGDIIVIYFWKCYLIFGNILYLIDLLEYIFYDHLW